MKVAPFFATLFFIATISACSQPEKQSRTALQESRFRREAPHVMQEIQAMLANDQAIRNLAHYGTADTVVIDSLTRHYAARGVDLDSLLLINPTFFVSKPFYDSIHRQMAAQDEQHTRRLIAMISDYGYPDSDRIDSTTHISPFLLLHHPAPQYKDTILSLLSYELKQGRIDTVSCEMIKWDLNGREGLPNIPQMKVERNADGTTTLTL